MERPRAQPLQYAPRAPRTRRRTGAALAWMAGAVLSGASGIFATLIGIVGFLDPLKPNRGARLFGTLTWCVIGSLFLLVCIKCVIEARVASGLRKPSGTWWR